MGSILGVNPTPPFPPPLQKVFSWERFSFLLRIPSAPTLSSCFSQTQQTIHFFLPSGMLRCDLWIGYRFQLVHIRSKIYDTCQRLHELIGYSQGNGESLNSLSFRKWTSLKWCIVVLQQKGTPGLYSGEKEQNATFIKMTEMGLENMVILASTWENVP